MDVVIAYFEGCPGWERTEERLQRAITRLQRTDIVVRRRIIASAAEAHGVKLHGSPTVIVDGQDPFLDADAPTGLYSRTYRTPVGAAVAPTVDQLIRVLRTTRRPVPATVDLTRTLDLTDGADAERSSAGMLQP